MSIKKYMVFDNISNEIKKLSEDFFEILVENQYKGSFYAGYPIFERDNSKYIIPIMFVSSKGLVILTEDEKVKNEIDRFIMRIMTETSELKDLYLRNNSDIVIFIEKNKVEHISEILESKSDLIEATLIQEINSYLQSSYSMNRKDKRIISSETSLGSKIKQINTRIATLDETQFDAIFRNTEKHMRIRGLAGSGKTILLARKMAYLHFNKPNLKMVYIFYSVSLKEYITSLFIKFYRDLAPNKEPNFEKIFILHGWGSKSNVGFYSYIANHLQQIPKTFSDMAKYADRLEGASQELLQSIEADRLELFDYVFIDEAQDFGLHFFRLAVKSLTTNGKMFYAYDELQSLSNDKKSIPGIKEIFQTESSDICETINLEKSYRCPNNLLVSAHALGLGIYHEGADGNPKFINMIDDLKVWNGVGYHVESGELAYGKQVVLARTEDQQFKEVLDQIDVVKVIPLSNMEEQINAACIEIVRLLNEEDVLPEDILIIDLDSINLTTNGLHFRNKFLEINQDDTSEIDINLVNKNSRETFNIENQLTYTTVFRAKGNEANIVFILNAGTKDNIYLSYSRNRLFTAMTRAKVRTYVYSDENKSIHEEVLRVQSEEYMLNFIYPTEEEMKKINTLSQKESRTAEKYTKTIGELEKLLKDKSLASELKQDIIKLLGLDGDSNIDG